MRKLLKYGGIGLLGILALLALLYVGFEATALLTESSLPEIVDSQRFDREIWQVSRVFARDGRELAEFYKERRTIVPVDSLPDHLLEAVVAAEDKNFYQHDGIDWMAIGRAVVLGAVRGRIVSGASTITQQLARNLYLSRERTLSRKVHEALMARKIESSLSKREILHQYLNLIYWGHGRYGVEEAAQLYFGKHAASLDLAESIVLAGIIRSPELLSPFKAPDKTQVRMAYVQRQMVAAGFLPEAHPEVPLPALAAPRPTVRGVAPYAVDAALVQLFDKVERDRLEVAGFDLRTTVDPELQRAMNEAVAGELDELDVRVELRKEAPETLCECIEHGRVSAGCPLWGQVLQARDEGGWVVDALGRLGWIPGDSLVGMAPDGEVLAPVRPGAWVKVMPDHAFSLLSPWLTEEVRLIPVVRPQVAAVLLDAVSGEVLALYGGVDHRYHPYNRAITARRQVGSTIKPFIYLAAMELLGWDRDTQVDARALTLNRGDGRRWRIRDAHAHDDRLSIENALALSSNCAAVRTLRFIGTDSFVELWQRWGLPPLDTTDLSLALGSASLSPLELATAYAVLANGRCTPDAVVLRQAREADGTAIVLPPPVCAGTPPSWAASELLPALEAVVRRGTGKAAAVDGLQLYGKTGTSTGGRDAWFAGVIERPGDAPAVLVVWVGSDDFSPIDGNAGPSTAARLWGAIVKAAFG